MERGRTVSILAVNNMGMGGLQMFKFAQPRKGDVPSLSKLLTIWEMGGLQMFKFAQPRKGDVPSLSKLLANR